MKEVKTLKESSLIIEIIRITVIIAPDANSSPIDYVWRLITAVDTPRRTPRCIRSISMCSQTEGA